MNNKNTKVKMLKLQSQQQEKLSEVHLQQIIFQNIRISADSNNLKLWLCLLDNRKELL